MKNYYLLIISTIFLVGCLFDIRQKETKDKISQADKKSTFIASKYKTNIIRKVKPYEAYRYKTNIKDPFKMIEFLVKGRELSNNHSSRSCLPPDCMPPKAHKKGFLENYSLDELIFAGTLNYDGVAMGLVKTPNLDVIKVKKGDYMGYNNGKVLSIKEAAIILHEKIYKSGIWVDRKTVLMINKK